LVKRLKKAADEIKRQGAYFTPSKIAQYMAKHAYSLLHPEPAQELTVLDPSCGDGQLLAAMYSVLKQHGHIVHLIGIDNDMATISLAERKLHQQMAQGDTLRLEVADFLDCTPEGKCLDLGAAYQTALPSADIIIANPPYVRTQVIGSAKSQKLANKYGLKGKVDLYHAFFASYSQFLKDKSVLSVITSNRYLFTKSGGVVRSLITDSYDIDFLIDLGDTKIFSAAVLPAILFAHPAKHKSTALVPCTRVYETDLSPDSHHVSSLTDVLESGNDGYFELNGKTLKKTSGFVRNIDQAKEPWILVTQSQSAWLERIESNSFCKIEDVAKVRVGIKTTADNVFIRSDWDELPSDLRPEKQLLKPLLSSDCAERWSLSCIPQARVLYPHVVIGGKRKPIDLSEYPHARSYLEQYYDQLNSRSYIHKAKRKWYEIWVPQNPDLWDNPKVVFPDISSSARFYLDKTGAVVDGNCYWITPNNDYNVDILFLILAVANSDIINRYHSLAFQNVLYSGKRRYLTQYIKQYPLPNPESSISREIITYLKERTDNPADIDQERVNVMVASAFGQYENR
jgi:adenine-specific DNA-methyltransferase